MIGFQIKQSIQIYPQRSFKYDVTFNPIWLTSANVSKMTEVASSQWKRRQSAKAGRRGTATSCLSLVLRNKSRAKLGLFCYYIYHISKKGSINTSGPLTAIIWLWLVIRVSKIWKQAAWNTVQFNSDGRINVVGKRLCWSAVDLGSFQEHISKLTILYI